MTPPFIINVGNKTISIIEPGQETKTYPLLKRVELSIFDDGNSVRVVGEISGSPNMDDLTAIALSISKLNNTLQQEIQNNEHSNSS